MRPRLEAIASSMGSNAGRSTLTRADVASKVAGRLFFWELVHTHSEVEAAAAAFNSETRRVERVQRIVSCGCPLAFEKVASLPPFATA